MARTIITKDGDLVNYANVVFITVGDMSAEDEDYSPDESYVLVAYDVTKEKIPLGFYSTYESACNAKKSLIDWLCGETFGVYKIDDKGAV